ncbi:PD-(D/E)XK nuclease family protein [Mesorhizobium atlanticum]|uniref:PD-(D/E)XK endonuclease-like domain-containing protein n=1 Tax=Mesorhizobium atlanticum TaxID=2233532 RepID=A0A330GJY6_9HYPH|nr:PD-(D/E)XK nuclease family protein [Mesorhizobium atlanticum]RAZ72993.1 hypothetical protein DPM35_26775 [Mesorhizobium atlanticum]
MRWSYSSARMYRQCQRKWFYANVMASTGRVKDEARLRARRLKSLSTLSAWRGQIVDTVISERIVPELDFDERLTLRQAKEHARQLFDKQRQFAETHRKEDLTLVKSHHGDAFLLLFEHAYGRDVAVADYDAAWDDIVTALTNLYHLDDFRAGVAAGWSFHAQPRLHFNILGNLEGSAFPDLIVYTGGAPIQIIDWKVHADGANDARDQLASYAIALSRMDKPNREFPDKWQAPPHEIVLKEVQLLLGDVREHVLTAADLEDAELFMMETAFAMSEAPGGGKYEDSDIDEFDVATNAETCTTCAFRIICWEDARHA